MFLPVTAGSFLIEVVKEFDTIIATEPINLLLDAIIVIISGIVTFLAVKFIFKLIKKGKLHYFAYYCFAIALIGIIICVCTGYGF
jgi:undecaprenyl-diphosphatase